MPSAIDSISLSVEEVQKILATPEGHFSDVKAKEISPGKLTRTLSAFANSEGGEIYIGIKEIDKAKDIRIWDGFQRIEDANGFVQAFEEFFPLGSQHLYTFLSNENESGFVLKVEIRKSTDIKSATDRKVYLRRGAQNLPQTTEEQLERLRKNKGITSFETEIVNVPKNFITDSIEIFEFMYEVVPTTEPENWLKKQLLLRDDRPIVAGVLLFGSEPQAALPKRCGLKVYRYKSSAEAGTRETLANDPISIEGCIYNQIFDAVAGVAKIIEAVQINTPTGLKSVKYPETALHEIITNAVIHRDYSIPDDIHIRIFDNRVEVLSPGMLPGHITTENILEERFARNGVIVRLINKFPDAPNKDVGEGLNTAFDAMRDMKLRPPIIEQEGHYVKISLRHETLASPEEVIIEYLRSNYQITNRQAREICFIGSENRMKTIFQRMMKNNIITLVPGATRYTAAYTLVLNEI